MQRRSSYAAVAAGSSGTPTSSGRPYPHPANNSHSHSTSAYDQWAAHHYSANLYSRTLDTEGYPSTMNPILNPRMNPSWGRPERTQQRPLVTSEHDLAVPQPHVRPPRWFVPSYLQGSHYAEQVEELYKARTATLREPRQEATNASGAPTRTASEANVFTALASHSHRGIAHDIVERPLPMIEGPIISWPTRWDADASSHTELTADGTIARFVSPPQKHEEGVSLRADYPMPRQCGIYYYEVAILKKGNHNVFGVGFAGSKVVLSRLPGWEPDSVGYHGDDGHIYAGTSNAGRHYGPKFGASDVIGCGINFRTNTAFFTRNGIHLGVAARDIKPDKTYFPIIGAKRPSEKIKVNFGQDPFVFDIDKMIREEKARIHKEIADTRQGESSTALATALDDETKLMHNLVYKYLTHDGYMESARAFYEEVVQGEKSLGLDSKLSPLVQDDVDTASRHSIRSAILAGDIDKALKLMYARYNEVFTKPGGDEILFRLKLRKFIEMIARHNDLRARLHRSKLSSSANNNDDVEMSDNPATDAEADADVMDTTDSSGDLESQYSKLELEMIEYGQELKKEYEDFPKKEVKKALLDSLALVAFQKVEESPSASLLDRGARVPVAEEVNGAILRIQGKSPISALEKFAQDTETLVEMLAEDGGEGAFINVRRDCLQPQQPSSTSSSPGGSSSAKGGHVESDEGGGGREWSGLAHR